MGKRRSWFSAVKKAITRKSKETREKRNRKSGRCFGKQRSMNMDSSKSNAVNMEGPLEEVKLIEAENEQNRHAYSVALVTAMAAEAAVAAANAAAQVVRLRAAASTKTKEDVAALKIQTVFRGYLARRALKALRGLMRLRSVIGGKSVKRQATSTLKCMQTMSRVQSEIRDRRIRMLAIQRKHEKELDKPRVSVGENWDESRRSKEQIVASIQNRQEAAMRRERALAYAYSHQQQTLNKSCGNQTFMDPSNPRWGWSWLEQWMAWENGNADGSYCIQKRGCRQSASKAKIRPMSPRDLEDSKSSQSDQCRRRSSIGDDESFTSSSAIPSYMASTESARAKSRLPSPQGSEYLGTPERLSSASAKKRISFSPSPARLSCKLS